MKRTDLVVLIDERDAAEKLYERFRGICGRGDFAPPFGSWKRPAPKTSGEPSCWLKPCKARA
jgi:hypothetical protein